MGQPHIDAYRFGNIEIDGCKYTSDVIILPMGVKDRWWREQGHNLIPDDLTDVMEASPDVLVIGQGANGYMQVSGEASATLAGARIEAICLRTDEAVGAYNERSERGEKVAAALHLTC